MRRIMICALILITLMLPFYGEEKSKTDTKSGHSIGLGISAFKPFIDLERGDYFDSLTLAFSGRIKLGANFGIIVNVIPSGAVYYFEDPPGSGDFSIENNPFTVTDYPFMSTEYVVFTDIALFLPVSILEPYLALGPAFDFFFMGEGYENDTDNFRNWYDGMYGREKIFNIGLNVKLGVDIVIKSISIGLELNFMAHDLYRFIDDISQDPGYMIRNSQVGINALLWLL
jgi:hypothetical protein